MHRAAQRDCARSNGNRPCRVLIETMERCVAVAQGVRPRGLVVTSNPATYVVQHFGVGSGETLAVAEQAARQDCSAKLTPGMACRVAARRCG